uniref:NADAR domain-containing protein n=1 Tax=Magallana gigas TaxID=29159 RepID=K1Q4M7_MAGGI
MRCGDRDAAKTIKTAKDALSTKRLGDKVRINNQWSTACEAVMTEVIENKCVQVQQFREKLRSVKRNVVLAESTYNDTWGTGLNKTGTENTKQQAWPGKNLLGHILSKIAKKVRKRKKGDQWSSPQQTHNSKQSSKQRDIAVMRSEIRARQHDSDSASGRDLSSETDGDDEET